MKKRISGLLSALLVFVLVLQASVLYAQQAKNVILLIGDGMGFNADLAGTYWRFGDQGDQKYHQFPKFLGCTTFNITSANYDPAQDVGYDPEVIWGSLTGSDQNGHHTSVTDSGASASALNCGVKTRGGRICMDFNGEKRLKAYSEYAAEAGRSVGVVTTVPLCHATPAGAVAHNNNRGNYLELAQEMILNPNITVIMGSGNPEYENGRKIEKDPKDLNYTFVGGKYLWDALKQNNGFADLTLIQQKEEFQKFAAESPKSENLPKRLIGVPISGVGDIPPIDGAEDEAGMAKVRELFPQELIDTTPELSTMSLAALNVLGRNPNGFYLMIEGGAIDHGNHSNNITHTVMEHTGFAKAIDAVCDWIEKNSSWDETLVIVTADHNTGRMFGPGTYDDVNGDGKFKEKDGDSFNDFMPIKNAGQSVVPEVQYSTNGHSNMLVPIWIKGVGADDVDSLIRGHDDKAAQYYNFSGDYIDNTDVFTLMMKASGFEKK